VVITCEHCGAPLEAVVGKATSTCGYCGRESRVKGARTVAMEQRSLEPPVPSAVAAPRRASKRTKRSSPGCLVAFAVLLAGGTTAAPILLESGVLSSLPFLADGDRDVPTLGTLDLEGLGAIDGEAVGEESASQRAEPACSGYLPKRPQVALRSASAGVLRLLVSGTREDLVMAVQREDGTWYCDDDGGRDRLPRLELPIGPGAHRVFVGTFSETNTPVPFSLVAEGAWVDAPIVAGGVAPDATPQLSAITVEDPPSGLWEGGSSAWADASVLGACRGFVPVAPHLRLTTTEPRDVRLVTRDATADLVMVLRTPSGRYVCDDDSGAGTLAEIDTTLETGSSAVWVGTFERDSEAHFTLELSAPGRWRVTGHGLLPEGEPAGGVIDLDAPGWEGRREGRVRSELDARHLDPECGGRVGAAPDFVVRTTEARELSLTTEARVDLTMVVRHADGRLVCDDDSGDEKNPLVTGSFAPGAHQVWIGTFGGRGARYRLVASSPDV